MGSDGMSGERISERTAQTARRASSITVRGIRKCFKGGVVALDNVDVDIGAGEFFTLLGPSGSGKTTLLRIIAGFEEPTSGIIEIGANSVVNVPPNKRNVNTVFQSYALFHHLNVRDNVMFGLKMRHVNKNEAKRRVADIAATVKITELLDRRIEELSGGQQQRVALSRALVNEPDVLLLDEPLSALDAGLRGQLQIELSRIHKHFGMTFVFVTHDQQEAMVMSDRIAVLDGGRVQQVGTPEELYEKPRNLFVARFMGHKNVYPILEHGRGRIRTGLGWINGTFGTGTYLLVRPEAITLSADGADGADGGSFSGVVQERIYRGSVAEYRLACGNGEVVAKCANHGQRMFEVGDTVMAAVSASALVAFHE